MKFSNAALGPRAERPATFRHGDKEWAFALRPLSAIEEIDAVASAIALCKSKGSPAEPGKHIYDEGLAVATLAVSCVDTESPANARQPFFPSTDHVLSLDSDTIASLCEQQAVWQEETSPSYRTVAVGDLFALVTRLVEEVDAGAPFDRAVRTYLQLSPKTRLTLLHFMAALLSQSHVLKRSSSSPSASEPANPPNAAESTSTNGNEHGESESVTAKTDNS